MEFSYGVAYKDGGVLIVVETPLGTVECLTTTSGLVKIHGLGGTYLIFGRIYSLTLKMPSPSENTHSMKQMRVAYN